MNTQVTSFNFNTSTIRVVTIEGNPWFVGADIFRVLFGTAEGHSRRYNCLDDSESLKGHPVELGLGAGREVMLVSESGLYKLAMRSQTPQARPFQDWVTKEVLPSIRKTGSFVTGQPSLVENPTMSNMDLIGAQMGAMQAIYTAMQEQAKVQAQQAVELKEVKAQVADALEYASVFDFNKSLRLVLTHGQKTTLGKTVRGMNDAAGRITRTKEFDGQAMYPVSLLTAAAKKMKLIK
jgi:prophage antirepressor-like protein